jgi:Uma2 family endonuclease
MKFLTNDIDVDVKGLKYDSMSDDEFFNFCAENDGLRIERDSKKQIFVMAPAGYETGNLNSEIVTDLNLWNRKSKKGKVADSSAGFLLPDTSVLSPDASWTSNETLSSISKKQIKKFLPACPDFVIELKSPTDSVRYLKSKMLKWIQNGCKLAWLIIPEKEEAHIYRADGSIEIIKGFDKKLSGENILPRFELNLSILK